MTSREGVVFKSIEDPEFSFKIVSNEYLSGAMAIGEII